ncbi:mycofactocin biosynthesis glycosyltransferase MftF [Nocardioides nitrophenolicus]|uniref:mycofactocin biosynthesis glycosyltransferase MftF n=1 Tax=Nocardioides nitrophenolicus TaxID=60489 RepID=UPI00195E656E|nr:mycofactocin biosynthesis glycosyltransferase MftF [Nocardioides nitrophenolicus]MBM7516990.1 mycofactocin system glycosyltransferase [Nocardioides nitrophenolicus]
MTLPDGFTVRLRADVTRTDDLLLGGSPLRALRLTPRARALLDGDRLRVCDQASALVARRLLDGNLADPELAGPGPAADLLTVLVPVRDRAEQLDRALAALTPLTTIVVDDASHDPAAVARVAAAHGATVVALSVNVGPAGARNAGLAQVRTPYVAFVDSDVTVDAGTLRRLARHFADPTVALVGPRIVGRVRTARPRWFQRYDEHASSLTLGTRACSVRPGAAVGWLPSACLVARAAAIRPGFNDAMRVGEDVDLVWRTVAAGGVVRYAPEEIAGHDVRAGLGGWLGRKFVYGTGGAPLAARHGSAVAPAVLSVPMALAGAAALTRRRWSAPVVAVGLAVGVVSVNRRLPAHPGRRRTAAGLVARGFGWSVRQEAALLLRHWWPLTALALPSRTVRRMVLSALVVDAVVARREHPGAPYALVARRLDDLAYGAGLWAGAVRARSVRALLPRRPG